MSYTRDPRKYHLAVWDEPSLPRILIEGDSWVDHPLVANMAWCLNKYLRGRAHILNISESGDLIYQMARGRQFRKLQSYLVSDRFNFDLLFLSGGGNDILVNDTIGYRLTDLLQSASGDEPLPYLNLSAWQRALKRIEISYVKILDAIANLNPNLKIVCHTYEYIYPRNKGTDVIVIPQAIGPWVWPVMKRKGIVSPATQRSIISYMLDEFRKLLLKFEGQYEQLYVVDTLGTLPAFDVWGINIPNWNDEIHPDSKGFNCIVEKKIGPQVQELLNLVDCD